MNYQEIFQIREIESRHIYLSITYPTSDRRSNQLLLICSPLWDEQERALLLNTRLSRYFAKQGFTVVKFDFAGTGNSSSGPLSIDSIQEDVRFLKNHLSLEFPKHHYTLLAERASASILSQDPEVMLLFDKYIWLHPILNLAHFIKWTFIEREVVNHNAYEVEKITVASLLEMIDNEQGIVELNGYEFDYSMVQALLNHPPMWETTPPENVQFLVDDRFDRSKNKWTSFNFIYHVVPLNRVTWESETLRHQTDFQEACEQHILSFILEHDLIGTI